MNRKPKILVIVGPTASGKSALAVKLAKALAVSGVESEVVSADSRQVYKGMDIGTGKVTKREMRGVPHHLLDVANPKQQFSVARYQVLAYKAIDGILKRGKLPIVVGGTGHYVDAITKGLVVPEVPPNAILRRNLAKLSNAQVFKLLKQLDPKRAKIIDKNNPRRLVRAIEIAESLGKVPAIKSDPRYSPIVLGLRTHDLGLRIKKRVGGRLKKGWVKEVLKLHKKGLSWKRLENLGLGYKIIAQHLQCKVKKSELTNMITTAEIQYTKRQLTWFKRDKSIKWLDKADLAKWPRLASLPGLRRRAISPGQRS